MLSLGNSQAEVIPFSNFKERVKIMNQELEKGRLVDFDEENVYSYVREARISKPIKIRKYRTSGADKEAESFKCNSCKNEFRIITTGDIQWVVCTRCGGANIDKLTGKEELDFENKIN